MKTSISSPQTILFSIFLLCSASLLSSCGSFGGPVPSRNVAMPRDSVSRQQMLMQRRSKQYPRPRVRVNPYEGSLWRNEAAFGNLWRDHRARFQNDLLTINDLSAIITVPPPKQPTEQQIDPNNPTDVANVVLEAATLRDQIEEEQNDILRSLSIMSAQVVRVLPNGNMLIRGKKVDHRQRNRVRYVTTISGILRPADVNDSNIVSAAKLASPEVQIKRQVLGNLVRERAKKLAPLVGEKKSNLASRLSEFTRTDNN